VSGDRLLRALRVQSEPSQLLSGLRGGLPQVARLLEAQSTVYITYGGSARPGSFASGLCRGSAVTMSMQTRSIVICEYPVCAGVAFCLPLLTLLRCSLLHFLHMYSCVPYVEVLRMQYHAYSRPE